LLGVVEGWDGEAARVFRFDGEVEVTEVSVFWVYGVRVDVLAGNLLVWKRESPS